MDGQRDSYSLGCAGLAEGTNANTFKTSNILHFAVGGLSFVKAATDNIAMAIMTGETAAVALAAKQVCVFWAFISAAGTITFIQSAIKANSTGTGYVAGAFQQPSRDAQACIGALKVSTANAATFTMASTDFSATDVTVTAYNFAGDYGKALTY